ncbi:lipopolysaccharide biosynthesis protein [Rhizorhabdus sp. FW153]|uniref:lipopolysaccharide biosynthesis protein n=1 Tax=Rhizorhabdus sp. FW153 TaxID=3400216 RepID=UPI003CE7E83E
MMSLFVTSIRKMQSIGLETLWVILGNIASVVGSLLSVRLVTEFIAPDEYGKLALSLTIVGLSNQTITGGLIASVNRHWSIAHDLKAIPAYVSASKRLFAKASAFTFGLALIALIALAALQRSELILILIPSVIFSVTSGFNSALTGVQNAARQRSLVAGLTIMDTILKMALIAIVGVLGASTSTAILWCYCATSCAMAGLQWQALTRRLPPDPISPATSEQDVQEWAHRLWLYAWPFSTWGIFTWAQMASDRWALQAYTSSAEVGTYAVVYQLGYAPILLASGLLTTLLGPILFQQAGDATDPERNKTVSRMTWTLVGTIIAGSLIGATVATFAGDWLFSLLVAANYRDAARFLPPMVASSGFFAAGQALSLKTYSDMTVRSTIPIKIGTAILGVGLNLWLAEQYGLPGIVWASLLFSLSYFCGMAGLVFRTPQHPRPSPNRVDNRV